MRNAAKPMAESRNGPAEALATARVTTGFASAPSVVALEMMTIAMTMPAMPVMAPANATRASCAEPPTRVSALPSALRMVAAKCRNTKPASSIANAPIRLFHWLSSAQFVQA